MEPGNEATNLMHGKVGEEHGEVGFDPHDEPGLSLVSAGDHLHMVPHIEVLAELTDLELQGVLGRKTIKNPLIMPWEGGWRKIPFTNVKNSETLVGLI